MNNKLNPPFSRYIIAHPKVGVFESNGTKYFTIFY